MALVLGIESSCDETGIGVIEWDPREGIGSARVVVDLVASSQEEHARFGGVVPEIAARAHMESLDGLMAQALDQLEGRIPDYVVVTAGPGLVGALLVGVSAAKAYAHAWGVPVFGVNHLAGHVAMDTIVHGPVSGCVFVLVSGGHTDIFVVDQVWSPYRHLGGTIDDAAGEAFDKVARLLGLGYPGGPEIDRLAQSGNRDAFVFPRAIVRQGYDFSFSGVKTAVRRCCEKYPDAAAADIAASFQEAVADVLAIKTLRAARETGATEVVVSGGVGANSRIRELITTRCAQEGISVRIPAARWCTDNGVMIAALGAHCVSGGLAPSPITFSADPGMGLDTIVVNHAEAGVGAGSN